MARTPCQTNPELWADDPAISPQQRKMARHQCIHHCPVRHSCAVSALQMINNHIGFGGTYAGTFIRHSHSRNSKARKRALLQLSSVAQYTRDAEEVA
jgi:hypothetical protein